jgi:hypothetical protein
MLPPLASIASTSAPTSVSDPPSMYPSCCSSSDFREVPTRLMRVQSQAAEMLSANS